MNESNATKIAEEIVNLVRFADVGPLWQHARIWVSPEGEVRIYDNEEKKILHSKAYRHDLTHKSKAYVVVHADGSISGPKAKNVSRWVSRGRERLAEYAERIRACEKLVANEEACAKLRAADLGDYIEDCAKEARQKRYFVSMFSLEV